MPAISPRTVTAAGLLRLLGAGLAAVLVAALLTHPFGGSSEPLSLVKKDTASGNPATPGSFTGHGFDQCQAPSQAAMDTWLKTSPFLSAGIYISGDSRACRTQTNLSAAWVSAQLTKGWKLLPITLGPQASCSTRFPRYGNDPVIDATKTNGTYAAAAAQGTAEADKTLGVAAGLGLVAGSTMYYDLEAFDSSKAACRDSALAFLSAWTVEIKAHGYLSGVYSSAASGLKVLDQVRQSNPSAYAMPDQVWIADWNQQANTSSTYISSTGWMPHARVKQYQGGHNETYGGVTINIDRNFLDVGQGSVAPAESHCGGVPVDFATYPNLKAPASGTAVAASRKPYVKALKCLLTERAGYHGKVNAKFGKPLAAAVRSWRTAHGFAASTTWNKPMWLSLFAANTRPVLKYGSASSPVRDLQRALAVAVPSARPAISGVFDTATQRAVTTYQKAHAIKHHGIAASATWAALGAGKR
jgi:peptidoglycan hydrolase-like protein with peptidoglycan-binding domain